MKAAQLQLICMYCGQIFQENTKDPPIQRNGICRKCEKEKLPEEKRDDNR